MSYTPAAAGGLSPIGVWTTTDISALNTSDAEINNAWAGSTTVPLAQPAVKAGRLEALAVKLSGDVGAAGNDLVVTVYKNGVATLLTATISGGAGTENEVVTTVTPISFASGDDITVQAKRVGTPGAVQAIVTVFARLSSVSGAGESVTLAGDVTGGSGANTVEKIRGNNVPDPGASEDGKFLQYDDDTTAMVWAEPSVSSVTMGGDVTGNSATSTVEKIRGSNVPDPGASEDEKVLKYDHDTTAYVWSSAYLPGGTDVAVADGGTGASTATAGFDNLAPTTTKGDLIVHNGTDNIRLAVGSDDQVLVADSGEAAGVKWAAAGAGSSTKDMFYFRQVGTSPVERWYFAGPLHHGTGTATVAPGGNTLIAMPFLTTRAGTIDQIGARITTISGSGAFRLGVYTATSDTNLYPDALVLDSGELSGTSAAVVSASISEALSANTLYWFVCLFNNGTNQISAIPAGGMWPILGLSNALNVVPGVGWQVTQAYGALPDPFPAGASVRLNSSNGPGIAVRFSA